MWHPTKEKRPQTISLEEKLLPPVSVVEEIEPWQTTNCKVKELIVSRRQKHQVTALYSSWSSRHWGVWGYGEKIKIKKHSKQQSMVMHSPTLVKQWIVLVIHSTLSNSLNCTIMDLVNVALWLAEMVVLIIWSVCRVARVVLTRVPTRVNIVCSVMTNTLGEATLLFEQPIRQATWRWPSEQLSVFMH